MNTTDIIGKDVMHGSFGYENKETIKKAIFTTDTVEIVFESDAFSTMEPEEFEHFLRYEELSYKEKHHGGMSRIIFCEQ